jgi:small basic protein
MIPPMTSDYLPSLAIIASLATVLWGLRCIDTLAHANASSAKRVFVYALTGNAVALMFLLLANIRL